MIPKLISTTAAAEEKDCSRQAVTDAINRGAIDGVKAGRNYVIRANKKYRDWQPNPVRQQIGRESQRR